MAGGAAGSPQEPDGQYSSVFAFAYIFNLVIGVGALALPLAFTQAGLVLGTLLIITLAFMSFLTTSYVVEAMAAANAYYILKERKERRALTRENSDIQKPALVLPLGESDEYEIRKKYELGTMANMFYHPIGIVLYYVCICVYLYGDLAIYAVTIPKSMQQVLCSERKIEREVVMASSVSNATQINGYFTDVYYEPESGSGSGSGSGSSVTYETRHMCFGSTAISDTHTYYICLAVTVLLLCPWTFFNLTRSKYLQLFTTILRNVAFVLMILLAIVDMAQGHRAEPLPPPARFKGFPVLFGVSIYSFMCQHSLPGMITPMKTKKNLLWMIFSDFALILFAYLLLTLTGAFRFSNLEDIYTLNFFNSSATRVTLRVFLGYYLALFPVFTLSTNFPIISITLRENLKALFRVLLKKWRGDGEFHFVVSRIVFPLLAIIPPILIAFATRNVEALVSVTGSFPGVGVQYIIPLTLAIAGRNVIMKEFSTYDNKHKSKFSNVPVFIFVSVWTAVSFVLIIVDDALKIKDGHFI
ncbi:Transmembrane protein 104 [Geodia barretti]|uniref:Transmembrane protein 104 n=1 Tax=Geodia barretti TaxID=519541 RepID=A0AA35S8L4_GEOBA|nr:Transmembrane protein 104 [Geodia barretti]